MSLDLSPFRTLALDLSARMLTRAWAATVDAAIDYATADLERLELPEAGFDLAYSSLALHYVENLAGLLAMVHRALAPGGHLVLSIEHPIHMAPSNPGWSVDAQGRKVWPVDRYLVEGPRAAEWLGRRVVKQHRTIGTTLNLLIGAGFTLQRLEEFCPTEAQIAARPELAEERERPMFLLVVGRRQGAGSLRCGEKSPDLVTLCSVTAATSVPI